MGKSRPVCGTSTIVIFYDIATAKALSRLYLSFCIILLLLVEMGKLAWVSKLLCIVALPIVQPFVAAKDLPHPLFVLEVLDPVLGPLFGL